MAGGAPLTDDGISESGRSESVNVAAAQDVARQVTGQPVGFAVVDGTGRVFGSVSPNLTNRSASITKAMVLIALIQDARDRALSAAERELAAAMIRRSDNQAANALFARVGAASVNAVARRAGMTSFTLVQRKQTAAGYILGYSRVSAVDQARLFATIEELAAARHRAFAMAQLESIEGAGRFGILDARIDAAIRSKGGWRPESDGGWTVNQAAQVTITGKTYGFAVVLGRQHTFEAGAAVIASVARAAFSGVDAGVAGGDCDTFAPPLSSDSGGASGRSPGGFSARTAPAEVLGLPAAVDAARVVRLVLDERVAARGSSDRGQPLLRLPLHVGRAEQDAVQRPRLSAARSDATGRVGADVRQRTAEHEHV